MKVFLLVFVLFAASTASADMRGPVARPKAPATKDVRSRQPLRPRAQRLVGTSDLLIRFYQRVITHTDGPRCPMAPTCSVYGRQAVAKHGGFWAVFLVADRLLRESDADVTLYRTRHYGPRFRFVDPLWQNDVWVP